MPKVTFQPGNFICEAKVGDSLLDVALNHDVPLQHACGGFCACATCHILVESNSEGLSPMDENEKDRLETEDSLSPKSRLACQAKVQGDVVVTMVNAD